MRGYAAMHATGPDFFIHSGDTIYADGPITAQVTEPDGQIWHNLVTEEVSKVAETLNEFRGRHRYNMMDQNIRALYAEVPVIAQWDDHETHNNWYPGQILTDTRYTERRVDVLAARAARPGRSTSPSPGSAPAARDSNPPGSTARSPAARSWTSSAWTCAPSRTPTRIGKETQLTHILGQEQADWLIREVSSSKATWKVIANDLPLGLVVPDGPVNQESLSNRDAGAPLGKELELARVLSAFKRNRVKNVVWLTADVHYCAAHHYSPGAGGVPGLRSLLGIRGRSHQRRKLRTQHTGRNVRARSGVLQDRQVRQRVPAQRREPVLRPRGPGRGRRLRRQPARRQRRGALEQGPAAGTVGAALAVAVGRTVPAREWPLPEFREGPLPCHAS